MAGSDGGSGLFSLAWGVWATCFGWVIATDFRGAAHRFHRMSRQAPFMRVGFVRIMGAGFALAGPAVLVNGLYDLGSGQFGPDRFPRPILPVIAATALFGALGLWALWLRSGLLGSAWAEGPASRRAMAAVITVAVVGSLGAFWLGHPAAMLVSWLAGGLAALILLMRAA